MPDTDPRLATHEAHEAIRLERGRPLTDDEIACYIADHQGALRHATAHVGDEIAEQLRDRLTTLPPCDHALDVRRVTQAITNIAVRHHIVKDSTPSQSLLSIYGYQRTIPDMDAEIAREYAALGPGNTLPPCDHTAELDRLRGRARAVLTEWDALMLRLIGQAEPVARPSDLLGLADAILPLRAALEPR